MNIYHSIHTMTLQRKILLEKVSSYRSLLYGLSDRYGTGSYRKSENEYYFYMYTPQGVIISLRAARNCGFIKLTINLNSLLYMEIQRVALFSPCRDYMRTLDCNLRDILRDAQLGAPETFMFARVDFSVNAQTPDPLAYIALAHRGGVPNGFKQTYPRFDNKKRNKPDSLRLFLRFKTQHRGLCRFSVLQGRPTAGRLQCAIHRLSGCAGHAPV